MLSCQLNASAIQERFPYRQHWCVIRGAISVVCIQVAKDHVVPVFDMWAAPVDRRQAGVDMIVTRFYMPRSVGVVM